MNINDILGKFNENQLNEISRFLESQEGKGIGESLTQKNKEDLLRQFKRLNSESVRKALNGLTKEDIIKMIK